MDCNTYYYHKSMEGNIMQGNIVGNKYGRLFVLKISDIQTCKNIKYTCLCDCGKIQEIQGGDLRRGAKRSCGKCNGITLTSEQLKEIADQYLKDNPEIRNYHGRSIENIGLSSEENKRLYRIWKHMKQRCNNEKDKSYKYYGGLGIKICNEWLEYNNFRNWSINNGYAQDLTIDRIDNYGNYCPENCRWVDNYTQAVNRKNNSIQIRNVVQLNTDGKYIATHIGVRNAQRAIGAKNHQGISLCCKHKRHSAYGYKWMYQDEYERLMKE